jgi:hypothetical protein
VQAAAINPPVQLSAVAIIQWRARSCWAKSGKVVFMTE